MSHFRIYKNPSGMSVGKAFRLARDKVTVFEGCWADCHNEAMRQAEDEDTITSGAASMNVPAYIERQRYNENARACGLPHLVIEKSVGRTP